MQYSDSHKVMVLHQDDDMVLVAKPFGLETVSDTCTLDLTTLVKRQLDDPGLMPAHRLDRDTSGVQLFARNAAAHGELTALFRKRTIHKAYLALCLGVPRNRTGRICRNLTEWEGGRRPVRVCKSGGLTAETSYEVVARAQVAPDLPPASLIVFSPHQGRTHQIRVHAAAFGYPILGDHQYGFRPANRSLRDTVGLRRQALHSWKLQFTWHGSRMAVTSPLPSDMASVVNRYFDREQLPYAVLPQEI